MALGENATGADNQQGSPLSVNADDDPSETTRRTPFSINRESLSYLQGALHDATKGRGSRVRFAQKYIEWLSVIQDILQSAECNSWIYKEGKERNVYVLETTASFLDFDFNIASCRTRAEHIGYIRGFFDAEGGIPRSKTDRFYVQFVQKDRQKLLLIKGLLSQLSISSGIIHNPSKKVDPEYWRFFISTRSHKDFAQIIGSFHPIKKQIFVERMMI